MIQRPPDFIPGNEIHKGFEAWVAYLDEVSSYLNPFRMDQGDPFEYDPMPTVIPSDIALALQWYNLQNDGLKMWSIIRGQRSGWLFRHNMFRRGRTIMRADELGSLVDSVPRINYYRGERIWVPGKDYSIDAFVTTRVDNVNDFWMGRYFETYPKKTKPRIRFPELQYGTRSVI